jgi:hypothetical protein
MGIKKGLFVACEMAMVFKIVAKLPLFLGRKNPN